MNRDTLGERLTQEAREELPQVKQMQPEGVNWVESLRVARARSVRQLVQEHIKDAQLER
jgi:DNA-binding TFAR19-related protein (PDSD5 family)